MFNRTLIVLVVLAATGLVLTACGEKMNEAADAMKNMESIAESADNMQKSQDALTKRRDERRAKGDTLSLAPEELKKYLPGDIAGYKAEEPETQTMEIPGMSWCVASKNYTKDDGSTLKVTITDYNSSEVGWAGASALFALKMSSDNATESSKTFQTSDFINGSERFGKQDKSATIMYGLGGRFLLQVEASNQSSVDFVRSVATGMNLNKLSSL